jgi:hypothetical protein
VLEAADQASRQKAEFSSGQEQPEDRVDLFVTCLPDGRYAVLLRFLVASALQAQQQEAQHYDCHITAVQSQFHTCAAMSRAILTPDTRVARSEPSSVK